jgi:ribose-phosphate pyrophosphokinase
VFRKERSSDREVRLSPPALKQFSKRTPVLVDDIISSGATMIEAATMLIAAGMQPPHCIAVHGLFGEATVAQLRRVMRSLLTTDSVPNPYARLKIAPLIAERLASSSA